MLRSLFSSLVLLVILPALHAQAVYTATRSLSFQVGAAGSSYTLDYGEGREEGLTGYADVDFSKHFGIEGLYRNASIQTPHDIGENHLLFGPRLRLTRGRFVPYAKLLGGMGTINFQQGYNRFAHSETYFIYAFGGGLDLRATRHINLRLIDYEYQRWPNFPPHGLSPTGLSVGAAYVF